MQIWQPRQHYPVVFAIVLKTTDFFLAKVNPAGVKCKNDFRNIMCIFHNVVNRRKNKPIFNPDALSQVYGSIGAVSAYNGFVAAFNTKGNMKLLADSFQRQLVLADFRKWFLTNVRFFLAQPEKTC